MSVVAEFQIEPDAFGLGRALSRVGARAGFHEIVPTGTAFLPYLQVESPNTAEPVVLDELRGVPGVASARCLDGTDSGGFYRLSWESGADDLFEVVREVDVAVDLACGSPAGWDLHLLCEERTALRRFSEQCERIGVGFHLSRLDRLGNAGESGSPALTSAQQEALDLAMERGYFKIPRETTLRELGDELGVSRQSVSNRLRRATERLAERTANGTPAPGRGRERANAVGGREDRAGDGHRSGSGSGSDTGDASSR